uniref:Zinc metalloproteinase nas-36 n=1 Tax=Magallana gigas TaxID=29159 RepID=K1PVW8_MAGGI
MSFRDSTLESLVGSSSGLTHLDVREITQAYNCAGHCTNRVYCRNGGFVGADCTCVCPDGLSGTECQQVVGDPDCGGVVSLDAVDYVDLKSPNFPNRYPTDKVCTVILTAPTGSNIALDVVDNKMNLKQSTIDNSCSHWLEVRYVSPEIMGPKFCTPFKRIVSKSNTLMMRFDSRFSKDEYPYSNQMFHLRASTGGAGCIFCGDESSKRGERDPGLCLHKHSDKLHSANTIGYIRWRVLPHPQFLYERVLGVLWDLQSGTWLAMEHIRPWKRLEIFDNDIHL